MQLNLVKQLYSSVTTTKEKASFNKHNAVRFLNNINCNILQLHQSRNGRVINIKYCHDIIRK